MAARLYSLSLLVRRIHFGPAADDETIAASVTFLRYREHAAFKPVARPRSGSAVDVRAGKSFTFGVDRDTARALADRFVVHVHLDRTGPGRAPQRLSEAHVDVTGSFGAVLKDHCCSNNARAQVKTTVHFHDEANVNIASMDILLRLTPSGQTIVNEFNLDGNADRQKFAMTKGCQCPDFKPADANRQGDDDDDEWDIVGAELNNGQKIAIKYKKDCYQFEEPSSEPDGPRENPEAKPTESDERLNKHILKLMDQMHRMVAANISGVSERKN